LASLESFELQNLTAEVVKESDQAGERITTTKLTRTPGNNAPLTKTGIPDQLSHFRVAVY
jgi:hypothetical protein